MRLRCRTCQEPIHPDQARSVVASANGDWSAFHANREQCDEGAKVAYLQAPEATIQYVGPRRRAS